MKQPRREIWDCPTNSLRVEGRLKRSIKLASFFGLSVMVIFIRCGSIFLSPNPPTGKIVYSDRRGFGLEPPSFNAQGVVLWICAVAGPLWVVGLWSSPRRGERQRHRRSPPLDCRSRVGSVVGCKSGAVGKGGLGARVFGRGTDMMSCYLIKREDFRAFL